MPRNLNNRVELFFPVETEFHRNRILGVLEMLMADNQKSHEMKSDGSYRRRKKNGKPKVNAQDEMVRTARDNAANASPPIWQVQPAPQV